MDITAERVPLTRTVGGISERRAFLLGLVLAVGIAAVAWISNVEPLRVDTTVIGVRPLDAIVEEVEATSPRGESVHEFRLAIAEGGSFAFTFWLHNVAPFPVTIVSVGEGPEDDPLPVVGVRVVDAMADDAAPTGLPATIPPHGHAEVTVRMAVRSCVHEDSTVSFGSLPVGFRILGPIPRRTSVLMPMTLTLVGTPAVAC